ncbi:MAG: type I restriction enzyme HsdR N-terminal domain-containing protein [Thermodesulfobacteriota bacterium]
MADIPSHHMIYGTLADYVTGEPLVDTDDERYRQKLARLLVEEKGFAKGDLEPRLKIETLFAHQFVVSKIDLVVSAEGQRIMVVRYGPGSLVTRERPAIAAARVLDQERLIPLAVVTNGEDAELIDSRSGKVLATGLAAIPNRETALALAAERDCTPLPEARREPELRILNAFDVEICCAGGPCALPGAKEG